MAECAVTFVLEKLTVLLEENVNLLEGVKHEVEFIRDELERIIGFLRVADSMEETDAEIKVWVKQVRDVANEIEDVLDRFLIHHAPNLHTNYGVFRFFGRLVWSIRNLKSRYRIASEIQIIKSRVVAIAEGHQRYYYNFNIQKQGSSSMLDGSSANHRRGDALLLEEGDLVGIDGPKKQLLSWILEGSSGLKVVSVVGLGGSGKTTLVKKVYDDFMVRKRFDIHAWVTVSQSFKVHEVLKDMIEQLFGGVKQPLPEEMCTMKSNGLRALLREFLERRRYVIVLDDLWSSNDWEAIKPALPHENYGCRIILTTRLLDVASCAGVETGGCVYELQTLPKEESWTLFSRKVFQGSSCPLHLMDISNNILKKCGGLPLAIVAIAGVLASKNKANIDEWELLNKSLGAELEGNDRLESTRIILELSFDYLPYYLKPCFLYLSIYPEDHIIEHNTLIRLWIAEGFVKEKQGRTLEEVAQGYLNELVNRSLINVVKYHDDGSVDLGRIHDFYREIAVLKSRDQNVVTAANEHSSTYQNKVRRLSVHGNIGGRLVKRYEAKLRSMLTFSVDDPESSSSIIQLLHGCRMMKVLDLRGIPMRTFPKEVLKLVHLRYLSLRSTWIKELPRSIKKLQNLETLDLKQTFISELPVEILQLQYLRHLLVYHHVTRSYVPYEYIHGFKALKGIGSLTCLQKLSFIENPGAGSDVLGEIGMMKELRRLSIVKLRKEDGKNLCSSIENLRKLRSLSIRSTAENEVLDLSSLESPPPLLQRLYLAGPLEKVPHWIESLHSLVKIYFRYSRLKEDPLQYLQDLPNLVHLEILVGYSGERLSFGAGKFQKLRLLGLDNLEELRCLVFEEGAVPFLEKLNIQRCNLMERVPDGIEGLVHMKYLEFFDMPDEFIMMFSPGKEHSDYHRVSHIPEVYYTYWKDDSWVVHSLEEKHEHEISGQSKVTIRTYGQRNWL